MKRILTIWAFLMTSLVAIGQQTTMWSHFMEDVYVVNPAAGGMKNSLFVQGMYRNQWNALDNGVQGTGLTGHLPLYIIDGAVGGGMYTERVGAMSRTHFFASYNYVRPVSFGLLSAGLKLGAEQVTLNGDVLRSPDGDYSGGIDHRDDHLPQGRVNGLGPYTQLGIFLKSRDFQVGMSMTHLTPVSTRLSDEAFRYEQSTVITLHGQWQYPWEWGMRTEVFALLQSTFDQSQAYFGSKFYFQNNMSVGLAFRGYAKASADALVILLGFKLNEHLRLHYAYDSLVSGLRSVDTNNSHEFVLSYDLNRPIRTGLPPRIIYNPRY
jgi:type IX secretion system PorP/SprF family membrane protein